MAIKSLLAEFGDNGANGKVFLGGATALNLLGEKSATGGVPTSWKNQLDAFLQCEDSGTFRLGGYDIVKSGFYVKAQGIKFTETEHGSKGPAYWELGEHAAQLDKNKLAATMRKVVGNPATDCGDPWTATLIAAMFLSEVVRNPRSFMINLMLLDLLEGGVKYGRGNNKELDFAKLLKFDAPATGKTATYTYEKESVTVGKAGQAGTVRGGKLPMSHLGAMSQYKSSISGSYERKNRFEQRAKQSKLNLMAPDSADVSYHFPNTLLEKECTVLLRWLIARFAKSAPKYQIREELKTVTVTNQWTKQTSSQQQSVPIYASVSLRPLRDHTRQSDWVDAAGTPSRGSASAALVSAVKTELNARLGGVDNMLA